MENGDEFNRLALPQKDTLKLRGKLRSPLLERKINSHRFVEDLRDKEYFNFAIKMDRKSPNGLLRSNFVKINPNTLDHVGDDNNREFLFSVNSFSHQNSNNRNFNDFSKEASCSQQDCRNGSFMHIYDSDLRSKGVLNGNSLAQGSTVLPFLFDSKRVANRGRSAVVGARQSSTVQNIYVKRSFSLQDLKNLNPRISSARPVPEKRGMLLLLLTPEAYILQYYTIYFSWKDKFYFIENSLREYFFSLAR